MRIYTIIFLAILPFRLIGRSVAGGSITYNNLSGNTYQFHIVIWGDSLNATDSLYFDDGNNFSQAIAPFQVSSIGSSLPTGYSSYKKAEWIFNHTYPGSSGPGGYTVECTYLKRRAGILNLDQSDTTSFILRCNILVSPLIGSNSSPYATAGDLILFPFISTSNAFNLSFIDPDGDSLAYSLQPVHSYSNFTSPDIVSGGTLTVNTSGTIQWDYPITPGWTNVILKVEQWKFWPNSTYTMIAYTETELEFDAEPLGGIIDQNTKEVRCFPTVVTGGQLVNIVTTSVGEINVKVYDVSGRTISNSTVINNVNSFHFQAPSEPGEYLILISNDNISACTKLIVVHSDE